MTEPKLQPITGPGEYTQRNGLKAEIVGKDKEGNWHGWVSLTRKEREASAWHPDGRDYEDCETFDIVQPKPEIEISDEVLYAMAVANMCNISSRTDFRAMARIAIRWDRANRPKREPTEAEIAECLSWHPGPGVKSQVAAIRHAFELAQEPK